MSFPTSSHYQMLINAQRTLNDALPKIDKAEECGIDCTEYRQGHAYLADQVERYLRAYFPDQIVPPDGTGISRAAE